MTLDVYVDLFFLINFSMDYICLYITAKILREKVKAKRYIISSALGGIYSVLSLIFIEDPAVAFALDALVCIVMVAICFRRKKQKVRYIPLASLLYVGISMLLGGVMTAIFNLLNKLNIDLSFLSADGVHTYVFAIVAVISALISVKGVSLITKKNKLHEYYVTISVNGKSQTNLGFVDSGNLIKDQTSGKNIIFIDRTAWSDIYDPEAEEKYYSGEVIYRGSKLIPITTASGSSLVYAFLPDKVILKKKSEKDTPEHEVTCLISPTDLDSSRGYFAIIPEEIIKHDI